MLAFADPTLLVKQLQLIATCGVMTELVDMMLMLLE